MFSLTNRWQLVRYIGQDEDDCQLENTDVNNNGFKLKTFCEERKA